MTKMIKDTGDSVTKSLKSDIDEQNSRLQTMIENLTTKTEADLKTLMETDPLPQERVEKIKEEIGAQIKTDLCNISPFLKRHIMGSDEDSNSIGNEAEISKLQQMSEM